MVQYPRKRAPWSPLLLAPLLAAVAILPAAAGSRVDENASCAMASSDPAAGVAGGDTDRSTVDLSTELSSFQLQQPLFGAGDLLAPGQASSTSPGTMNSFRRHIIGRPNAITWGMTGGIVAGWAALVANDDTEQIEDVGDYLRILVPAWGLGFSLGNKDWDGTYRLLISIAATQLATSTIKVTAQKIRPNNANFNSFPSGHSSGAWSGAAFIQTRYGPRYGIPAYLLASYTSYSRVKAEKHHADDVIAGAALALMTNWLVVTPIDERVAVSPTLGEDSVGVQLELRDPGISPARVFDESRPRQWRFQWEIGGVWVRSNTVRVPDSGDPIDFRFDENSNPSSSTILGFEYSIRRKHQVWLALSPLEVRDFGTVSQDTSFAGVTVPAGIPLRSLYLLYDWRVRYRHEFLRDRRLDLRAGGGISVLDTEARLRVEESDVPPGSGEVPDEFFSDGVGDREISVIPLLHGRLGTRITKKMLGFYVEADVGTNGDDRYLDAAAIFQLSFGPRWEVLLGYRRVERRLDTSDMFNEIEMDRSVIGVSYKL